MNMKCIGTAAAFLCLAGTLNAQSLKVLCPKILNASGLETGVSAAALSDQFEFVRDDGSFDFAPVPKLQTYALEATEAPSRFKISIEEITPGPEGSQKKVDIVCPLVRHWNANLLPETHVFRQTAAVDESNERYVTRSGVNLTRLFNGRDDFWMISLFWRVTSSPSTDETYLPRLTRTTPTDVFANDLAADDELPVRGVRLSTTPRFGAIWSLMTAARRNTLTSGQLDFIKRTKDEPADRATLSDISRKTAHLNYLDFYDSVGQRLFPCSTALSTLEENSCYRFNQALNPILWKQMVENKTFYVQLLLQLEQGFLVQTYAAGGGEEPKLIEQKFSRDLRDYGLPLELF